MTQSKKHNCTHSYVKQIQDKERKNSSASLFEAAQYKLTRLLLNLNTRQRDGF